MLLKKLTGFFTSLRLTVVLLAFGIVLVWVGTVAQADEGLYNAQTRYFKQWLVVGITLFGKKIPMILPGGYLIGTMLLVNLISAHIYRFQLRLKKIGIYVVHAGIILLLAGQLATDIFSRETQIRFSEGERKAYSESPASYELVFITGADADSQEEIVIPGRLLVQGGEVKSEKLPFTIRVKNYWHNSEPAFRAPMMKNGPALSTNGIAVNFDFRPTAETKTMDDKNVSSALIEIIGPNGSLGDWVVSDWAGDAMMVEALQNGYTRQMGAQMAQTIVGHLLEPQVISVGGKQYTFKLRPQRTYHPFSLTLLKATHSVYRGTMTSQNPEGIPKDFRSRVRLENPGTRENREVEIFMNSPLRYLGLTFYQYQMSAGEVARQAGQIASSTLQVVRNPGWFTPYVGCIMVAAGLVIQFLMHLIAFISKRKAK